MKKILDEKGMLDHAQFEISCRELKKNLLEVGLDLVEFSREVGRIQRSQSEELVHVSHRIKEMQKFIEGVLSVQIELHQPERQNGGAG